MANITLGFNDFIYLSMYQDDDTGVVEIVPIRISDGSMIGEPVIFDNAVELAHIIAGCMDGDFKIFEKLYTFISEWEGEANDNTPH